MNIVLVGAGGSGLSNIAHILYDLGYTNLVAIDGFESQITRALQNRGIKVQIGHGNYQVKADDILIYSEAVKGSPEVQSAFQLKLEQQQPIKIWNYFQFLGEMSKYFRTVGFAGTNGKSSSTSLAITTAQKLFPQLGLGIVGALVPDLDNKSYYIKTEQKSEFRQLFDAIFTGRKLPYDLIKKRYFFIEACEYKRHFLNLDLEKLLITNIELDHTDYFVDEEDYCSAYLEMMRKTSDQVLILENLEKEKIKADPKTTIVSIQKVDLKHVRGNHTDQNASLVIALLQQLNPVLSFDVIHQAMQDFKGIWRRMEFLTTLPCGALLYSDYGHIASSLALGYHTLKQRYPNHKITVIFQPHQMHRVLTGWSDFQSALALFDEVAIYQIYAAREKMEDFSNEPLFQEHNFHSVDELGAYFAEQNHATYLSDFIAFENFLEQRGNDEVVVVFSAGELDFQIRRTLELI